MKGTITIVCYAADTRTLPGLALIISEEVKAASGLRRT